MIRISKDEAAMLRKAGRGEDVHMSSRDKKSNGKRYFATQSYKTMKLIEKYRTDQVCDLYCGE